MIERSMQLHLIEGVREKGALERFGDLTTWQSLSLEIIRTFRVPAGVANNMVPRGVICPEFWAFVVEGGYVS